MDYGEVGILLSCLGARKKNPEGLLWGRWAQKSITYLYIRLVTQAEDGGYVRGELICVKRDC